MRTQTWFTERFGPWAVVAGASEGLGAAFARGLAARGIHVVLLARRAEPLERLARDLRHEHYVEVRCVSVDLGDPDWIDRLRESTADLVIGTGIYNAAFAPIDNFIATPLPDLLRVVDVNVRGPIVFARTLAPAMVARRQGAIVLMSSLAGLQGSPRLAAYAASKAFNTVLGEGLWGELRAEGVDVLVACAGAIRTPGYAKVGTHEAPGTMEARDVAEQTLASLGGGPRVIPGFVNRLASIALGQLLPRRTAIAIMASSTRRLS